MAVKQDYIDIMVGIPGFSVKRVSSHEFEDGLHLMIELSRKHKKYRCRCGREFQSYYDGDERSVRDLAYGPFKRSCLVFFQVRVDCPDCGVVTESLDWVLPRVEYSKRLAAAVALACHEIRSLKSVAAQFGLHEKTVKRIDKEALAEELPSPGDFSPRLLGVDEFALRKRHVYATVVADLGGVKPSVCYVGKDRRKESLDAFFRELGPDKCRGIEAVAIDMWRPYENSVREYCPQAAIVYDPFHVVASYNRDVIDSLRREESWSAMGRMLSVLKGSRWLLLKRRQNLDPGRDEPARLAELMRLNNRLFKAYLLGDDLRRVWEYRSEAWARKWFDDWYRRAMRSGVEQVKNFARKLKKRLDGILSHCRYPIHTGYMEGIITKIKVIKRVAFGFRDLEYFFLKIRSAFRPEVTHA